MFTNVCFSNILKVPVYSAQTTFSYLKGNKALFIVSESLSGICRLFISVRQLLRPVRQLSGTARQLLKTVRQSLATVCQLLRTVCQLLGM